MLFIFVSPLLGFVLGSLMMVAVSWIFRRADAARASTAGSAACSSSRPALYSLGHGGNDAQKTIGIIWMLLIATGYAGSGRRDAADLGDRGRCYVAIGLGTMFGGWRIVKTMGQRSPSSSPVGGFCAETGGAITLFLATGARHPGVDDAHHHRRDRRRRLGAARLARCAGAWPATSSGPGSSRSRLGLHRRARLGGGQSNPPPSGGSGGSPSPAPRTRCRSPRRARSAASSRSARPSSAAAPDRPA